MFGLASILPWWWRIAAALVIAAFGAYEMHKLDTIRYDALASEFQSYKAQAAAEGKLAQVQAQAQNAKQKEAEDALRSDLAGTDSAYATAVARLRQHSIRPDGSSVPVASCSPQDPSKPSTGQWVPLGDYEALEARSIYDAQTVMLFKAWVDAMQKAGAIQVK